MQGRSRPGALPRHEGALHKARRRRVRRAEAALAQPTQQYNFVDSDSRVMRDNARKCSVQSYNAQLAVDAHAQIIVAAELTQQVNDEHQFLSMARSLLATAGAPKSLVADAGYWNTELLRDPLLADLEVLVCPDSKRLDPGPSPPARAPQNEDAQRMRARLSTPHGRARYDLRKQTVEPVFGQIKEIRRIRRFRFRGLPQVECEWKFICTTHNLLKLFRYRTRLLPRARPAAAVLSDPCRRSRRIGRQKRDFAPSTPICRCRPLSPPRRLYLSTSAFRAA